jgi:hypothetical protein
MNERINGLWWKARIGYNNQSCDPEVLEKFAELIVRECVRVMYNNAIKRNVPPDINQTPTHYAVAVLEHFGVEE